MRFRTTALKFNVVQHGTCWRAADGDAPVQLMAGDALVVSGSTFLLASDPSMSAVDAGEVFSSSPLAARVGQCDEVALLGGSVALHGPAAGELLELLKPVIVIRARHGGGAPLALLLDELKREWRSDRIGSRAICDDLLRLMFVHALRQHIDAGDPAALGWIGALAGPPIAAVLRAIHASPARTWSLEALSAIAAMSRSAFALRFKRRVGQPPVIYAAKWRMRIATRALLDTTKRVSSVAASLGFLSDAAFGVAFKREYGVSPGRYRTDTKDAE
ncbi:AraC family transcriptional regulator [Luteimonas terrae]|uniref:AraC family transcriptional regulator n=1 Tax=Luteimonas terrae TaxID=1530191 RepID=UPI002444CCF5|nr:AraC family transcriptional regulator [Luteimonas terrae]